MVDAASNDVVMYLEHSSGKLDAESSTELNALDTMTNGTFVAGKFFEVESFTVGLKLADDDKAGNSARTYETWRSTQKAAAATAASGKQLFFAKPDELSITRVIDKASPTLLQHCLKLEKLTSGVLVKRGRNSAGALVGFFKLTFSGLTVRSMDWSDDEIVREVCRFRFEKLVVDYNRRKADGSKLTPWNCVWAPPHG